MRFVVSRHGLEPFDEAARAFLEDQIDGEPIDVELTYPRDMNEHRRIMAQISDVAKMLHMPFEKLRAELLVATGNFQLLDCKVLDTPVIAINSMSRHNMRDHELHEFWHDAKEVIRKDYLPLLDPADREIVADTLSLAA
jgi:hypothetical protein